VANHKCNSITASSIRYQEIIQKQAAAEKKGQTLVLQLYA